MENDYARVNQPFKLKTQQWLSKCFFPHEFSGHQAQPIYKFGLKSCLYELKYPLIFCHDLGFVNKEVFETRIPLIEVDKLKFNGFINFIFTQKKHKLLIALYPFSLIQEVKEISTFSI